MSVTFDAGALVAVDRGDRRVLALLERVSQRQARILIPAGVVAQAWRDPRQAHLGKLLRSSNVDIIPLDEPDARAVGMLLGLSRTSDTVDAHVVLVALRAGSPVLSSDADELRRLDGRLNVHAL